MSITKINKQNDFSIEIEGDSYKIITGNYMFSNSVDGLKGKLDQINSMSKDELKAHYKEVLNNGEMSPKGGGGLGIIDIARKSGENLIYDFMPIDDKHSFFTLNIRISQAKKELTK